MVRARLRYEYETPRNLISHGWNVRGMYSTHPKIIEILYQPWRGSTQRKVIFRKIAHKVQLHQSWKTRPHNFPCLLFLCPERIQMRWKYTPSCWRTITHSHSFSIYSIWQRHHELLNDFSPEPGSDHLFRHCPQAWSLQWARRSLGSETRNPGQTPLARIYWGQKIKGW